MEQLDILNSIRVASPCSTSWDGMDGNERARFCGACHRNVYNLSGMTRMEAEDLVREMEGRLCVRFYRRRDGTVLTSDCPVGLRRARQWLLTHVGGLAALLGGLLALLEPIVAGGWLTELRQTSPRHTAIYQTGPGRAIVDWLDPTPPQILGMLIEPMAPSSPTTPSDL